MKPTLEELAKKTTNYSLKEIEEAEMDYYMLTIAKAKDNAARGGTEGIELGRMIALVGGIGRMRQTRSHDRALDMMIEGKQKSLTHK